MNSQDNIKKHIPLSEDDKIKLPERFKDLFVSTLNDYYIWLELRNQIDNSSKEFLQMINERYTTFLVPVMWALQDRWLLWLANLFDDTREKSHDQKVISVYELINAIEDTGKREHAETLLTESKPSIHKLRNWRRKSLGHKDLKMNLYGYDNFTKENELPFTDAYQLLLKLWQVYNNLPNVIPNIFDWMQASSTDWVRQLFWDLKHFVPRIQEEKVEILLKRTLAGEKIE